MFLCVTKSYTPCSVSGTLLFTEAPELVSHEARRKEKEALDEYSRDFFSGKVLSTLFGDDVPNGTPINFDEEDLDFRRREGRKMSYRKSSHVARLSCQRLRESSQW